MLERPDTYMMNHSDAQCSVSCSRCFFFEELNITLKNPNTDNIVPVCVCERVDTVPTRLHPFTAALPQRRRSAGVTVAQVIFYTAQDICGAAGGSPADAIKHGAVIGVVSMNCHR